MTRPGDRRDLLLGGLAVAGGLGVAVLSAQIGGMPGQPFSPGFFPRLLGALAAAVGLVLALRALRGRAPAGEEEAPAGPPLRLATAWVIGGLVALGWLMEPLGFAPAMVGWLFGFLLLLRARPLGALLLALVLTLAAELAFTRLLSVPLPPGEWRIALGF